MKQVLVSNDAGETGGARDHQPFAAAVMPRVDVEHLRNAGSGLHGRAWADMLLEAAAETEVFEQRVAERIEEDAAHLPLQHRTDRALIAADDREEAQIRRALEQLDDIDQGRSVRDADPFADIRFQAPAGLDESHIHGSDWLADPEHSAPLPAPASEGR